MKRYYYLLLIALLSKDLHAQENIKTIKTNKGATLTVRLRDIAPIGDSLLLTFDRNASFSDPTVSPTAINVWQKGENGLYRFMLPWADSIGYFSLWVKDTISDMGRKTLLLNYLLEPGDQIKMTVSISDNPILRDQKNHYSYVYKFEGTGYQKLECMNKVYFLTDTATYKPIPQTLRDSVHYFVEEASRRESATLQVLDTYKTKMSREAYQTLFTDYNSSCLEDKQAVFRTKAMGRPELKKQLRDLYKLHLGNDYVDNIPVGIKLLSKSYTEAVLNDLYMQEVILAENGSYNALYNRVKSSYQGALRDKLLAGYFVKYNVRLKNIDSLVKDASAIVQTRADFDMIQGYAHRAAGRKAYPFTLPDPNGRLVSLKDFTGKIVFIDFWFTGCSPCMMYYKSVLKKVEEKYKDDPSVVFMTVSMDRNKHEWLKSVRSGEYTSHHVVNLYTAGQGLDHELLRYYKIRSAPQPMLIDQKGIVRSLTDLREEKSLVRQIEQLRVEGSGNKN